ncbi:Cytochrome c oxidase subunit NDUFA4-like, partial [Homarus americanus]
SQGTPILCCSNHEVAQVDASAPLHGIKFILPATFTTILNTQKKLIPLYVCVGAGVVGAAFYTLRLATRNPDVTWNRVTNPEPQQEYAEKQYKFYSPVRDYATYRAPVPKFSE